jgi:hypothetical protein
VLRKIQVGDEVWPDGSTVVHRISGMPAPANDRAGMTDIKSVVAGNERRILSALGITLHQNSNQHFRCPYPDHQHPSWRWGDAKRMAFCT